MAAKSDVEARLAQEEEERAHLQRMMSMANQEVEGKRKELEEALHDLVRTA